MKKETVTQDLAMAMVFPESSPPLKRQVTSLRWDRDSLACLNEIHSLAQDAYRQKSNNYKAMLSLPTDALRVLFQCQIDSLLSVGRYMGLEPGNLQYKNNKKAFAIFSQSSRILELITSCIEEWIEYELVQFMERWGIADSYREELFRLLDESKIALMNNEEINIFPWGTCTNGTASQNHKDGYAFSANDIALLLEEKEIIPQCGPVLRNVGDMSGTAELMTFPIDQFSEGRFSLVCQVSMQTIPSFSTPLIYFDFIRRRWLESLTGRFTHRLRKSAFLISKDNRKSYTFHLSKNKDNNWKWNPDDTWGVLDRRFGLGSWDERLISNNQTTDKQILVPHDFDTEGEEKNKLGAGVPEVDRISFFEQISNVLEPLGFQHFTHFKRIKNSKKLFTNATYFINYDFINNDEEVLEKPNDMTNPESTSTEYKLDDMLNYINTNLLDQNEFDKKTSSKKKLSYVDLNLSLLESSFKDKSISLLLLGDNQAYLTDLKTIISKLFANKIKILTSLLPEKTHGPEKELEGYKKKKEIRKSLRMSLWKEFANEVVEKDSDFICLIQARRFYQHRGKTAHDDSVNKPAAKLAFASDYSIPTQYLLPPNIKKSKDNCEKDYLTRIQQALLDLVFGHQGCVFNLKDHIDHYFLDDSNKPNQLLGIAVYSPTDTNRSKGATVGVASRLNVISGSTEVKICHQEAKFIITDWMPFKKAISYIASRHNLKISIGKSYSERQKNFQTFCQEILDEANQNSPGSVIFIKAEHSNQFWGWLKDVGTQLNKAKFNDRSEKQWKSLRVIRVRNQAPKLLQDKETDGFKRPTTVESIFKVNSSTLPIYWSLGSPNQNYIRGKSCYLEVVIPHRQDKTKDKSVGPVSPTIKQASRPNAVEFVILSCLKSDDPDQLARFSTSLRRGIVQARLETWVSLPAPLFVLEKIQEYLKL